MYNLIIIGAGIAGLSTALQYLEKYPDSRVCILEKYNTLGGRVVTYKTKLPARGPIHWENGAGRIHSSHGLVLDLIKRYGLTVGPIDSSIFYKKDYEPLSKNTFDIYLPDILEKLEKLPDLGLLTFYEAFCKILKKEQVDKFMKMFPYWSEVYTLRADLAIKSFQKEMGSSSAKDSGFLYCKEGLSAIIDAMVADCKKRGTIIFTKSECIGFKRLENAYTVLTKDTAYSAEKVVFAIHANALRHLKQFMKWTLLKYIKMEPLLRCYAVFPKNSHGIPWNYNIPRFVTNTPLRYYIPINPKEGICMISYTDGLDAKYWLKILKEPAGQYNVRRKILSDIRKHFPDITIPDPLFFKTHPWNDGCSYWTPGNYDPSKASKAALQPFGKKEQIYCCNESFSLRQAWMEGSLEHAIELGKIL